MPRSKVMPSGRRLPEQRSLALAAFLNGNGAGDANDQQRGHRHHERAQVHQQNRAQANRHEHHAGKHGCHDPRDALAELNETAGAPKMALGYQQRHRSAIGRLLKGVGHRTHHRQQEDLPQLNPARKEDGRRHQQRGHGRGAVARKHHQAAVRPIHHGSGQGRNKDPGKRCRQDDQTQQRDRRRLLVYPDPQCERRQRGTQKRHELSAGHNGKRPHPAFRRRLQRLCLLFRRNCGHCFFAG